ncbi:hypothetical protein RF683_01360 [Flavobacterium sp. 20NA77.7]|uniref:2TM domain-containing protein n=1 Tax=Flavobacterium nakdongensis TaxID=3073563 RepID=A0ABY9RBY5_9FLAO|nr:hypothetical protein [Flavobacterium sp. 20NA77.7]WMW78120.1 hypothetical protein RF683_01360 [Flavobacterium sp. 20NA77.7]
MKNYWKRFSDLDKGLTVFFMINLFLDILNKNILNSVIPIEIVGYLFWLSLGLFLGFKLCKYEYSRTLRKQSEEQK